MELINIASQAIVKAIKNTKGGKEAIDELSLATWNWIRPIFLKDDEEFVQLLETDPDDQDLGDELKLKLKRKSKSDSTFASELTKLLKGMPSGKNITNITQNNVHGDNVGGDKIVNG